MYDKWLEDIPRQPYNRTAYSTILATKAKDTRNILEFHSKCLDEVRKLFQYPTGQQLEAIYWRAYFMDDNSELPVELGDLFEEYLGNMNVDISALESISQFTHSQFTQSDTVDKGTIVSALMAIATWNISKTFWGRTGGLLNHFFRFLLCLAVSLFTTSQLKKLQNHFMILGIMRRYSQSNRFLTQNLETFTEAEKRLSGRNFCITENGHVAWVSLYAKKGDEICVFRGCRFPFVIRMYGPRHNRKYRLRGDCYLHGLMEESLFEKARADVETIKLI